SAKYSYPRFEAANCNAPSGSLCTQREISRRDASSRSLLPGIFRIRFNASAYSVGFRPLMTASRLLMRCCASRSPRIVSRDFFKAVLDFDDQSCWELVLLSCAVSIVGDTDVEERVSTIASETFDVGPLCFAKNPRPTIAPPINAAAIIRVSVNEDRVIIPRPSCARSVQEGDPKKTFGIG